MKVLGERFCHNTPQKTDATPSDDVTNAERTLQLS
jgi:hypothetical protein